MDSSSQAFRPAKTEETVSHHQKNRCYGGGDLASARQLVYSASCSFNCCAEQGHSVRDNQLWRNCSSAKQSVQL